jgi:hypothetical protein
VNAILTAQTAQARALVPIAHIEAAAVVMLNLTIYKISNDGGAITANMLNRGGATHVGKDGNAPLSFPLLC